MSKIVKNAKAAPARKTGIAKPIAPKGQITEVKPAASGGQYTIVAAGKPGQPGYKALQIPQAHMTGELAKLAKVGGLLKAVEEYVATHKPRAKLANGVTSRENPNTALANAQQGKGSAAKPAPAPKTAKAAKPAASGARKRGQASGPVPQSGKIVIVAQANPYREGTKAAATFDLFKKAGTIEKARAMATAADHDIGYLRYASRDGFIAFA